MGMIRRLTDGGAFTTNNRGFYRFPRYLIYHGVLHYARELSGMLSVDRQEWS